MNAATEAITEEMNKVIIGKDDVIRKVIMSVLANGHILLDDVPGVGKTSIAVALGKTLGMKYNRIQFTPDVLPSDIVGFSIFNRDSENLVYVPGIINDTNLLLADEINRTSSRTQSALLEAMEEKQVTVDGKSYQLPDPFIVIATQNQVGAAGTQVLPHAQMDRFLTKLSIGYPDKMSEKAIILGRQVEDPFAAVGQVASKEVVKTMQELTLQVTMKDEIVGYIADLVDSSRNNNLIELGISPRGAIAVSHMAKACALMNGRDYVTEEDVRDVFLDTCAHRILLTQKARAQGISARDVLNQLIGGTKTPYGVE
ncbi:MAG: MoxR family ATPase [Mogibacterium sp.]|nr:MoxR family ATPase [Mogibacterium sp.]